VRIYELLFIKTSNTAPLPSCDMAAICTQTCF